MSYIILARQSDGRLFAEADEDGYLYEYNIREEAQAAADELSSLLKWERKVFEVEL